MKSKNAPLDQYNGPRGEGAYVRVMLIFEDVIFPLWNHLFLCYPCHADFKTAFVFKIGPILVVDVNF